MYISMLTEADKAVINNTQHLFYDESDYGVFERQETTSELEGLSVYGGEWAW